MAAAQPESSAPAPSENLAKAQAAKAAGNAAVGEGNWKQASFQYKHVNLFVGQYGSKKKEADAMTGAGGADMMGGIGALVGKSGQGPKLAQDQQLEVDTLVAVTQANLALAHINLGRFPQAAQCCDVALLYQPDNLKARFRRATAKLRMGQLEAARADLEAVLGAQPDDAAAQHRMTELVAAEQAAKAKEKRMCARMFGGEADDDDAPKSAAE